ncbi:MAG: aminotransferase class I/II-fold pyridoxal phosphate-dependent enzyme [Chloroflexi bacterium]|nr:aminotransferase class I/II-fold pyridoxal phosphate-dependent enzyme [Chloroflexota bacterium]
MSWEEKDGTGERFGTRAVQAGEPRGNPYSSVTTPIVQTSAYTFPDSEALERFMEERMFWDKPQGQEYGRYGNPTVRAAEAKLAALEEGEDAILVSSGMAAITTALLILLRPGDHLIVTADAYRRTRAFCRLYLRRWGVQVTVVPSGDYQAIEEAIRPETRYIFSETPTNPFLRVLDLERVVSLARAHGVGTIIDSTIATPYNLRPLSYGADLVIHSVTKYLAGHNDLLAGVVIGRDGLTVPLREAQAMFGAVVDPTVAYLILRGLKTLELRIERQNTSAMAIARFLEEHPRVRRVWYPGLESHPDHPIAARQMRGFSGLISFEIDGSAEDARRFVDALRIPRIAPSFGGVESLVEQPALMSYYEMAPEDREALGITDQLVRLSVGVEALDDLLADLEQALSRIG